jgi:hypothetical protein
MIEPKFSVIVTKSLVLVLWRSLLIRKTKNQVATAIMLVAIAEAIADRVIKTK